MAAGDRIEYLQDRAEGTCFVRIGGLLVDADPCPAAGAEFRLETRPATEWWIHVVLADDSKGWLLVGETTANIVDRKG